MVVTISASLSAVAPPAPVIIVVNGVGAGVGYRISGSTISGYTWDVNGGSGVGTGDQITVADILTPINEDVTYSVTVGTSVTSTATLTVPSPEFVLQSLDGRDVFTDIIVADSDFAREFPTRVNKFDIPGRSRPLTHYDIAMDGTGSFRLVSEGAATTALWTLLRAGAPLVYRQSGIRDLPPVEVVQFESIKSTSPVGTVREWDLQYAILDHPQPGVPAFASTWDTFDAIYSTSTWTAFDAEWATLTWDAFDAFDWSGI